jgi:fluoride ion exporter CrcB/FEX
MNGTEIHRRKTRCLNSVAALLALISMGMFWTLTNAASIVLIAEFVSTLTTISFLLMELIKASDKSEQVLLR